MTNLQIKDSYLHLTKYQQKLLGTKMDHSAVANVMAASFCKAKLASSILVRRIILERKNK